MAAATIPVPTEAEVSNPSLMELAVDRAQFFAEVQAAARVTEGKSTVPILTHLLLKTTADGALSITGSDLQRTLTTECAAALKTQGSAAVPGQKLLNYLKLLPNGRINLKLLGNDQLQITAGHSRTKFPGLGPAAYPSIPSPSGPRIQLSARALRTVIRQSLFAVATSQDKFLLNAGLLMLRSDRMGRLKKDGSYTSICLGCLAQVARKGSEAELAAHDNVHRCDPGRLAQRYFAEPPRLARPGFASRNQCPFIKSHTPRMQTDCTKWQAIA
jgi:DNA polymerase III beta subunit, N-terminal domain